MSTKWACKGVAVLMEIASVYTVIAAIFSLDVSGKKGETFDAVTFDGAKFKHKGATGFVESPTLKFEYFYDPTDVVHQAYDTWTENPGTNVNFKTTYADSGPTSVVYEGVAGGNDIKAATNDGLKATGTVETNGPV